MMLKDVLSIILIFPSNDVFQFLDSHPLIPYFVPLSILLIIRHCRPQRAVWAIWFMALIMWYTAAHMISNVTLTRKTALCCIREGNVETVNYCWV